MDVGMEMSMEVSMEVGMEVACCVRQIMILDRLPFPSVKQQDHQRWGYSTVERIEKI
jgi:hypothetical protein